MYKNCKQTSLMKFKKFRENAKNAMNPQKCLKKLILNLNDYVKNV